MKKPLKRMFPLILIIFLLILFFPIMLILYSTIVDYRPDPVEKINHTGGSKQELSSPDTLAMLSWNIGYCGLGEEMDFFYEGGKGVRPPEKDYLHYQDGVLKTLFQQGEFDFYLFQEVDKDARRSYYYDQVEALSQIMSGHSVAYAKNYDVPFVPLPVTNPMGKVQGGIVSISKYTPASASRYAFIGDASWPMGLFMLDRCFVLERFRLPGDKDLVVINTHNSAFDDGSRRQKQLAVLKGVMLEEYSNGNFVVAGGDWNLNPVGYLTMSVQDNDQAKEIKPAIAEDFFPQAWTWAFDPSMPTNREVGTPYQEGKTPTTIIDFFVCSPNIEVLEIKTLDLRFKFSDHNPVILKFRLKDQDPSQTSVGGR